MPNDLLARPAARQYRLDTFALTDFVKSWLCSFDQGQQFLARLYHFFSV
jgi:hypothetical protein